jgi:hypothetical protein
MNNILNTAQIRTLLALVFFMVLLALGSYTALNIEKIRYANPIVPNISVSGTGEVLAVPDIGKFSFSVTAEAQEAAAAQETSGTKINAILAYLREQGIADKDIKVEYYNLYPKYRWEEKVCPMGSYCPPGEQVQDGFTVTQQVSVKVRETNKAPAIIAGVGERGATDISGLSFTIDDIEMVRAQARAKAIEDARAKAVVLAEQLGVTLVDITAFYEEGGSPEFSYKAMPMAMDAAEEGFGGAELPVGEESTTVRVNITYEVR